MEFHLENFDGPLDLLLHLITANKVSIYDIPIADILEQYMEILNKAEQMDLDVAGDFVAMAARLMYIKSKMLLPKNEEDEEEDPRLDLVAMLIEYQKIKDTVPLLKERGEFGRDIFVKPPENIGKGVTEYRQSTMDLVKAAGRMLDKTRNRLPPSVKAFSGIVGHEKAPVGARITAILKRFISHAKLKFMRLFDDVHSRTEIVATFLAVLELSKSRRVMLEGEGEDVVLTLKPETKENLLENDRT